MKSKKKIPKDRNPYFTHVKFKSNSGAHGKSKKAVRRKEKVSLKKKSLDGELVW